MSKKIIEKKRAAVNSYAPDVDKKVETTEIQPTAVASKMSAEATLTSTPKSGPSEASSPLYSVSSRPSQEMKAPAGKQQLQKSMPKDVTQRKLVANKVA